MGFFTQLLRVTPARSKQSGWNLKECVGFGGYLLTKRANYILDKRPLRSTTDQPFHNLRLLSQSTARSAGARVFSGKVLISPNGPEPIQVAKVLFDGGCFCVGLWHLGLLRDYRVTFSGHACYSTASAGGSRQGLNCSLSK